MSGRIYADQTSLLPDIDSFDWMASDHPMISHNNHSEVDSFVTHQSRDRYNFAYGMEASHKFNLAQSTLHCNGLANGDLSTISRSGAYRTMEPDLKADFEFECFDVEKYLGDGNGDLVDQQLTVTNHSPEVRCDETRIGGTSINRQKGVVNESLSFPIQNQALTDIVTAPYAYPEWNSSAGPGIAAVYSPSDCRQERGEQQLNAGIATSSAPSLFISTNPGQEARTTAPGVNSRVVELFGHVQGAGSSTPDLGSLGEQIAVTTTMCQDPNIPMEQAQHQTQLCATNGNFIESHGCGECHDNCQPDDSFNTSCRAHAEKSFGCTQMHTAIVVSRDTSNPVSSCDSPAEAEMIQTTPIADPMIKEEYDGAQLEVRSLEEAAELMKRRASLTLTVEDDRDDVARNQSTWWVLKLAAAMTSKWKETPDDPKLDEADWYKWQESQFQKFKCLPKWAKPGQQHYQGAAWILFATVLDAHMHGPRINHPSGAEDPNRELNCSRRLEEIVSVISEYPIIRCDVIQLERLEELVANPRGFARQKIKYRVSNSRRDTKIQQKKRQPIDGGHDEHPSKRRKGGKRIMVARSTNPGDTADYVMDTVPVHNGDH